MRSLCLPVVAILAAFAAPASAHDDWCGYDFTQIGVPNTRNSVDSTGLIDINDRREIVGGFVDSSGKNYVLNGGLFKEALQIPERTVWPQSINNNGEIVGSAFGRTDRPAFYRDRNGNYTIFNVPNANLTEALGISNNGYVVGDYRDAAGFHGFVLRHGSFETIDAPFPGETGLVAVNRFKDIVGFTVDAGLGQSFLLSNGVFTPIAVPGAFLTTVTDINDRGQIVGVYTETDPRLPTPFRNRGFVWLDGDVTLIDAPFPGTRFTEPEGINDRGELVGRVLFSDGRNVGFTAVPRDCGAAAKPEKKNR